MDAFAQSIVYFGTAFTVPVGKPASNVHAGPSDLRLHSYDTWPVGQLACLPLTSIKSFEPLVHPNELAPIAKTNASDVKLNFFI